MSTLEHVVVENPEITTVAADGTVTTQRFLGTMEYDVFTVALCPKCHQSMRDLRHTGFNPKAMEADGVCFLWSDTDFTCSAKEPK